MNILCLFLIVVFKEADMLTDELGKWDLLIMQEQGEIIDTLSLGKVVSLDPKHD